MLLENSKKIVIKLGSSTVVDKKGNFKKNGLIASYRILKNIKTRRI